MIVRWVTVSILLMFSYNFVHSADVTFCDGPDIKIQKSREQCSSGFNFGDLKPDCMCVKGIYRLWTDTCETADGFAEEVCTKLKDPKTATNIVGMKLTKDPVDWSQTGVVCEKRSYGVDTWDLITENTHGSTTKNNNIYVMNGKPFYEAKGSRGSICVQAAKLPEEQKICKYLKKDNPRWNAAETLIEVKKVCKGLPMEQSSCFGVLKKKDSECELTCQPKISGRAMGRTMGNPKDSGKGKQSSNLKEFSTDNLTNPADYRNHDNKFLNRKMLIYNIISQIEESPKKSNGTAVEPYGDPKKTFELFHMMKNITQKFCPNEYVNSDWIELAINLFYILHRGNIYRYEETLNDEEYVWIKSILTTCLATVEPIELTIRKDEDLQTPTQSSAKHSEPPIPICDGGKATGYCNGSEPGGCNYRPVTVASYRANSSFHYVPDVAWDIVDLIQVACFDSFNSSYRMFHVLEQAAEKLFSLQIKNLWYFPGWSKKTKTRLLGAASDLQMHNFEVCIESAYDRNGKIPRLVRPMTPKYLRKKRSVIGYTAPALGKQTQVYCSRSKKEFLLPKKCRA